MTELLADEGVQDGAELEEVMKTALATGRTYAEVGVLVRRSARTVRRRMSRPQFAADVSARRGEYVAALTGQLVSGGSDAVAVLPECLTSGSDWVRLSATGETDSWRGFWMGAVVVIPLAITVTFSLDASGSRSIGANLWVVGAAFLAVGSFAGTALVAATTRGIRSLVGRWPYRTSKGQT